MAMTEQTYLLDLWSRNICPTCGKAIPDGTRVGSGRKSEGGFCSLDCNVRYYAVEIHERVTRLMKLTVSSKK
jgi:hypothetical protein